MSKSLFTALCILVCALATWATRALPFLLFGGSREMPKVISYLGRVLPASIMVILVFYCLRAADFASPRYGMPELISVLLVAGVQFWKKNLFLSIFLGTVCYMVLIRTLFV